MSSMKTKMPSRIPNPMIRLFIVNEITLVRAIFSALVDKEVLLLAVEPMFPPLRRFLNFVVGLLLRSGRAKWAIDLCPELQHIREYPDRSILYDIYGRTEDWQDEYFEFRQAELKEPLYAFAYKHITTNYTPKYHVAILVLQSFLDRETADHVSVIGLNADIAALINAYFGECVFERASGMGTTTKAFNLFVMLGFMAYSIIWIMARIRPLGVPFRSFQFAADYFMTSRDLPLYRDLADIGPILLVERYRGLPTPEADLRVNLCKWSDGRFTLAGGLSALGMVVRDTFCLYRSFGWSPPGHFYYVAPLPFRRAVLRAFFTRFRPKYFWGRDPYNVEHILRRQELNSIGGVSLGINVGYVTWTIALYMYRYVSFDRFYVFGREPYEKYYQHTWANDMTLVPTGTYGAARDHFARRFDPRPHDIVIFAAAFIGAREFTDFVRGLAEAFPERNILLEVKGVLIKTQGARDFITDCTKDLPNVRMTTESVYELFFKARYSFCDPSSVITEAMQLGTISFAFDIPRLQKTSIFREYPEMVVATADDAAWRIRGIESGCWHYPLEKWREYVDLSGRFFTDQVRIDIGLSPKEPAIPLIPDDDSANPRNDLGI
jgi:hypothetical protein